VSSMTDPYSSYVSMRWLFERSLHETQLLIGFTLLVGLVLGLAGSRMSSAQEKDNLKGGKILQRTELKGAPGWEAILVDRPLPPGAESGKHTQAGNEIVYISEGSVIFEAQCKPAKTLKPGEAFTTVDGEVHTSRMPARPSPRRRWLSMWRKKARSWRSCRFRRNRNLLAV